MKNKKIIIISLILLIIFAVTFGIYRFYSTHLFNEDGTVSNISNESFIENVKTIENDDEFIMMVNFALENGILNQKEADELLKSR